jgi:hypothetical protein
LALSHSHLCSLLSSWRVHCHSCPLICQTPTLIHIHIGKTTSISHPHSRSLALLHSRFCLLASSWHPRCCFHFLPCLTFNLIEIHLDTPSILHPRSPALAFPHSHPPLLALQLALPFPVLLSLTSTRLNQSKKCRFERICEEGECEHMASGSASVVLRGWTGMGTRVRVTMKVSARVMYGCQFERDCRHEFV